MPAVPYSPVPDVAPQNIPTPKLRVDTPPAAFGANVAQAIEHLGSTEGQVGNELFARALAMQQLRNEAEATDATSQAAMRSDKLFTDFESQKRGLNAVNGEEAHRKAQDDLRQEIRGSMSNPMAQKMFDSKSLGLFSRAMFNGARHAAAENRSALNNSYQSEIQAAIDTAGNAKTPEELRLKLDQIDSTTADFSAGGGLDESSRKQLAFKDKSAATSRYIEGLARRDPVAARNKLDEEIEAGRLHGNDRDRIEAKVHSQLMTTGASTFVNQNEDAFRNPEGFLAKRGSIRATGVDQQFGQNLVSAIKDYEGANPGKLAHVESLVRTTEEQARIRAEHEAMPGGVEAHPAAQPGTSRHEFGRAADVDSSFADWLRQGDNAKKYGLEFLPGKTGVNDPNHVQLAGDAPLKRMRTYDINPRSYVEGAVAQAKAQLPNAPPEMLDRVRNEATALYNRNVAYDRQQEQVNKDVILSALDQDNPPRTTHELLSDPKNQAAWEQLDQKDQDVFVRRLRQQRVITDNDEWARLRGMSQSQDEDERQKFLKEDVLHNDKLAPGHQREIMKLQDTVRKQAFVEPRVAHAESQLLDAGIVTAEDHKDQALMARLRGTLWDQIDLYQKVREAYPKPEEIRQMGSRIMSNLASEKTSEITWPLGLKTQTVPNISYYLGFKGPRLIDTPIPTKASDEITEQWSSSHGGIPPTDEQIKRIYIGQQYQELYGKK
jgi:hypothetical protein